MKVKVLTKKVSFSGYKWSLISAEINYLMVAKVTLTTTGSQSSEES